MSASVENTAPKRSSPPNDRVWLVIQAALAGALFGTSWTLWTPQTVFPQVPLVAGLIWPDPIAWGFLLIVGAGLALQLFACVRPGLIRAGAVTCLCGTMLLILEDQHRIQAWAIHLLWIWTILLVVPEAHRSRVLVWLTAAIYAYSAFSKFDIQFSHRHGKTLLFGLAKVLSLDPSKLPPGASKFFPVFELLVAAGLVIPRYRRVAAWMAIAMHAVLILIFSPWGLNHSWSVLLWNGLLLGQAWFYWSRAETESAKTPLTVWATIAVIVAVPALRLTGHLDQWIGWSLYSPRSELIRIRLNRDAAEIDAQFPAFVYHPRRAVFEGEFANEFLSDRWSLAALDVPLNPESRMELAIAIALCERFDLWDDLLIEYEDRSSGSSSAGSGQLVRGKAEILRLADSFRVNPLPNRRYSDAE